MKNRRDETFVLRTVGTIFSISGAVFMIVALTIHFVKYGDIQISPPLWGDAGFIVSFIFMLDGAVFFLLGTIFCTWAQKRRRRIRRLIAEGDKLTADIKDIVPNYMVRANRRHPYNLLCCWHDKRSGITYHFKSGILWHNPARMLEERGIKTVTVYVDRANMKKYHVLVPGFDERDVYL